MARIQMKCEETNNGWICEVDLEDDTVSSHTVRVPEDDYESLVGSTGADVEELVEASFEYLLEQESQGAIMSRFGIMTIERYFPDYPDTIPSRL